MSFSDRLKPFFKTWREIIKSSDATICMGSEACDIDSFVCSIAVAIHEKCAMVVNMSRKVFESKGDLMYFCSQYKISTDELIFLEKPKGSFSLEARKLGTVFQVGNEENRLITKDSKKNLTLILVDHHKPIEELQDYKIDLIIDHHALSGSSLLARRIYVDIDMGSCATLVSKYIGHTLFTSKFNKHSEFESNNFCEGLARMLMIPILVDTANFKKVTSHFDFGEFMKLKKRAKVEKKEINKLRKEIKKGRLNDAKMETEIILRKDYKRFTYKEVTFGISTVKYSFEKWVEREAKQGNGGSTLEKEFMDFRREDGLDFFMVNRKAGPKRYLAIINCSYEKKLASAHHFNPVNYRGFHFYEIPAEISRKLMVPILKKLIDGN